MTLKFFLRENKSNATSQDTNKQSLDVLRLMRKKQKRFSLNKMTNEMLYFKMKSSVLGIFR